MTFSIKIYLLLFLCFFNFGCVVNPFYVVHGVTFEFEDISIVEPKHRTTKIVEEAADAFEPYLNINKYKPVDGVLITATMKRPTILLAKEENNKIVYYQQSLCGLTWPGDNSYIYHKELIDGCGTYELKLHYMHHLFPGQSEQKDIEWMKQEGIL